MKFMKLSMYSPAMQCMQDVAIYYPDLPKQKGKPETYPEGLRFPVLYLIHGGGGNYMRWPVETTINELCDTEQTIIVMPTVSDRQDSMEFSGTEEFVAKELPEYISWLFPVSAKKEDTYIGGFSFGGYFAWRVGLRYPERFGAVASFSSPIDIITDLKLRPQENYVLEELAKTDHNLFELIRENKAAGKELPRLFESFGDETDMCFEVNKTAIDELNHLLGNNNWYWIQGKGPHSLVTCNRLIRKFFAWVKEEK